MFRERLIEPIGFMIAAAACIFSLILFYNDTDVFWGSLAAALFTAALVWITYILLRLILLTFRK